MQACKNRFPRCRQSFNILKDILIRDQNLACGEISLGREAIATRLLSKKFHTTLKTQQNCDTKLTQHAHIAKNPF